MNEAPLFRVGQTVRVWYLRGEPFDATVLASWVQDGCWLYRLEAGSDWMQFNESSLVEMIEAADVREGQGGSGD